LRNIVIGYYVHHRGAGHRHRALAIAAAIGQEVTILSSAPQPERWDGPWISLPLDTPESENSIEADAGGALHYVPIQSAGLRTRMAMISAWIEQERPAVMVVDVSVEVAVLARLHGIPVVTVAQPGDRSDAAHLLGYRLSSAIIAPWPDLVRPLTTAPDVESRVETIGAISRIHPSGGAPSSPHHLAGAGGVIVVLTGEGGRGLSAVTAAVEIASAALPQYTWRTLRGQNEETVAAALREATLVIAHCGQNAVAEIAASRTPAILIPEDRPHGEQSALAAAIASSTLPARTVRPAAVASTDWSSLITEVTTLDGADWMVWCDGAAAERAAAIITRIASMGDSDTAEKIAS
jgi:predicted glycosyltransferase